jgi:hypothetical protein
MGIGGGGGSQSAGFQVGNYWSPGGLPSGYSWQSGSEVGTGGWCPIKTTAGANFQVPAGKTYYLTNFTAISNGGFITEVGYADDAAGTNVVVLWAGQVMPTAGIQYTIPGGKYFVWYNNSAETVAILFAGFAQ